MTNITELIKNLNGYIEQLDKLWDTNFECSKWSGSSDEHMELAAVVRSLGEKLPDVRDLVVRERILLERKGELLWKSQNRY